MKTKIKTKTYNTKKRLKQKQVLKIQASLILTALITASIAILANSVMPEHAVADVNPKKVITMFPEAETDMKAWVLQRVYEEGLNPDKVDKLINCESKWNPEAHGVNWDNRKGVDRGLWQISSLYYKDIPNSCTYDYKCATEHAIEILKKRGFKEWTCGKLLGL